MIAHQKKLDEIHVAEIIVEEARWIREHVCHYRVFAGIKNLAFGIYVYRRVFHIPCILIRSREQIESIITDLEKHLENMWNVFKKNIDPSLYDFIAFQKLHGFKTLRLDINSLGCIEYEAELLIGCYRVYVKFKGFTANDKVHVIIEERKEHNSELMNTCIFKLVIGNGKENINLKIHNMVFQTTLENYMRTMFTNMKCVEEDEVINDAHD